ncbi:hypothetical protein [Vibrio phage vB_VpM-pA2SJ1]|uniref:Uncharacterized protein n=1 Tax=Vibrio phage vB_VpM-pA2SJ1 TaxID=3095964 RepID=A0AAX4J5L9_9CAUD
MKKLLLSVAIAAISFSTLAADKITSKEYNTIIKGIETTTCVELGMKTDIDVALVMLPLNDTRPDVFKALIQQDLKYVLSTMTTEQFLGLADIQDRVEANPYKYCK